MENNLEKLAEKLKKSKQRIIAVFLSATILVSGIASCNFMKKNNKDNSKDKNAHDYESSILSMVEEELSKEDSLIEEEGLNEVERPTIKPEVTPHKIMPSEPKINNENNFEEINLSTIPEEKEEHICKYNEYEVLNDKYHKEICECGKFRTVEHSYNVLYTNYIYNYENTYTQVITKECSVCKHRIKEEKLLTDLEFTEWVYNKDTGKDERECLDYDIVEEREHKHEFTIFEDFDEKVHKEYCVCGEVQLVDHKLNVKNKEYIKNNDETYKEIITLECSDCKHQIIVENLLKDLEFTEWIYNKDTGKDERKCIGYDIVEVREHLHKPSSIINFDKEYEYSYCNDCQELIKTPHNLVSVVNPDYSITYKCENDGCNYSYKIDHIHNFGDIKRYDSNYEYRYCEECNEELKTSHNMTYRYNSDGTITYFCTNEGCNYSYNYGYSHTHKYGDIVKKDDEFEYRYCEDDGAELKTPHVLVTNVNPDGSIVVSCKNCDYTKTLVEAHEHNTNDEKRVELNTLEDCYRIDKYCSICEQLQESETFKHVKDTKKEFSQDKDDICYTESTYCTECDRVFETTSENHNLSTSVNRMAYTIHYDCTNEGCNVEYDLPCEHNYSILNSKDEDYEHRECSICGRQENVLHTYDHGSWGTCTTCGQTKEAPHVHKEKSNPTIEMPSRPIADYCYIEVYTCESCGAETRRVQVAHDIDYDNPRETSTKYYYSCKQLGCKYFESKDKEIINNNLEALNIDNNEQLVMVRARRKDYRNEV